MTVLIHRLGRIGDTMVAMPALRLIQRAFPHHRRVLLCDKAPSPRTSPQDLLRGSGIIDDVIHYHLRERNPIRLWRLRGEIIRSDASILVYLNLRPDAATVLRDWTFFRLCGIRRVVGMPWTADLRTPRPLANGQVEAEACRLARAIAELGDAHLDDPASWRLSLSPTEEEEARREIAAWSGGRPFIAFDVTAKPAIREWGEDRWSQVLSRLSARYPGWGALFSGGPADLDRIHRLAALWQGPKPQSCDLSPRRFYAWVRQARLFVGVDSGPMHLAAAAGVPVVALAAAQWPPGLWHPAGSGHTVLSADMPCGGCGLSLCPRGNACINAIEPDAVVSACLERLS